jgi:ATP-dependent Clp protease protease subunit
MVYDAPPPRSDDVADQLLRQRRVVVGGRLDGATATEVAARLMLLDGSGDEPVELLLSCPDGDGGAAMALADTVELMGVEVRTVCTGVIGGPAVLPFALGTRRLAAPHATFVLGDPALQFEGAARDLTAAADQHAALVATFHGRLAAVTGRPVEEIAADAGRRRLLTADEAVAYGLVDEIVRRHLRAV